MEPIIGGALVWFGYTLGLWGYTLVKGYPIASTNAPVKTTKKTTKKKCSSVLCKVAGVVGTVVPDALGATGIGATLGLATYNTLTSDTSSTATQPGGSGPLGGLTFKQILLPSYWDWQVWSGQAAPSAGSSSKAIKAG